jgi:hypothetical protein
MDIYTLDSLFKKVDLVEGFNSAIWTERYNAAGDVQLVFPANTVEAAGIIEGTFLYLDGSNEVMIVDTINTEDGLTKAVGQTLVGFLVNRISRPGWDDATNNWAMSGSAGTIANFIVTKMLITGGYMQLNLVLANGAAEIFSGLSVATAVTGTSLNVAIPFGNVYDAIKSICDLDDLGFNMTPNDILAGTGAMTFKCYRGLDRTSTQGTNGIVIFESAIDTFTNIKELRSISGYRHACYAWPANITAQSQIGVAYATGASVSTPTGFARRTMAIIVDDVDSTIANLSAILTQRAKDALANNNYIRMLDGQLVPQQQFVYGTHYNLGDIVELRGSSSVGQPARITEYIRSQDTSGEIAYPTLSVIN